MQLQSSILQSDTAEWDGSMHTAQPHSVPTGVQRLMLAGVYTALYIYVYTTSLGV